MMLHKRYVMFHLHGFQGFHRAKTVFLPSFIAQQQNATQKK